MFEIANPPSDKYENRISAFICTLDCIIFPLVFHIFIGFLGNTNRWGDQSKHLGKGARRSERSGWR
ncbi:hypothetical protein Z948_3282 [Sulfitobacter donghicola DSW-25 = KCTC 12864 = JCM 14565]|nr:hypothetical protein Z948_3282 [Sulfitobacter donghicola DSW-25 = KCTC 12864 = JCM 14565]